MTRLELLQHAFASVSAHDLSHQEAAIMLTLMRFSKITIPQMGRIIGQGFRKSALADLGRKNLISGKREKGARLYCYSLTHAGIELAQSILGPQPQPA